MNKQFYDDDAFYIEQKKYGLWQSHYPDGSGIITSLNEHQCVTATRWYLKAKQEGEFDKSPEKSYSTKDNYKL
jgi:hypothetical protein